MKKYKNYEYYLKDNILIIIEKINELIYNNEKNDFVLGELTAYYDIIDVFKQQALLFDIDIKDIGLDKIDEYCILLGKNKKKQ
ncbi:hypothetical protein LMG7974_01916 [Campylobacter majalis]|uniref:Acyl carrier protein n=1 Tax=Campylobacter majalis TaxID=2790656 RepID=A0ABM8QA16_9BACT|nr:hypothetical protein [Campylobacter majalis]CAD7289831.1 hypothetical protein LMG7974_01916 [Campylobacter majalis]